MMMKSAVSMAKPISWIGLRPQESIKRKVAQYPGIKPPTARMMLPTAVLRRISYQYRPEPLVALEPEKPMSARTFDVLRPRP